MASAVSCPFSRTSIKIGRRPSIHSPSFGVWSREQKATCPTDFHRPHHRVRVHASLGCSFGSDFPLPSGQNALRECNDAREVRMRTNRFDHPTLRSTECLRFLLKSPSISGCRPLQNRSSHSSAECLGSGLMQSNPRGGPSPLLYIECPIHVFFLSVYGISRVAWSLRSLPQGRSVSRPLPLY